MQRAGLPVAHRNTYYTGLRVLAGRVARNRELAGLHYATDSTAGQALARALFITLNGTSGSRFDAAVDAAKDEWP